MKFVSLRKRERGALTFETSEQRALLLKEWGSYKQKQHSRQMNALTMAGAAQQKALEALREESEDLYQQAIEVLKAQLTKCSRCNYVCD